MNIGLLEDNSTVCECMTVALELAGHKVEAHTTGASLLERLFFVSQTTLLPYDLLIVDLNLPGSISGQDVIERIRSTASMQRLPILIISGASEHELAYVKARFPTVSVIRKPFELRTIAQFVNRYCDVPSY